MLANRYVQRSLAIHPTVHIGVLRVELFESHHIQQTDVFQSLECLIYKVCVHSQWRYFKKRNSLRPRMTPHPPRGAKGIRDDPKDLPSYFSLQHKYGLSFAFSQHLHASCQEHIFWMETLIILCIYVPRLRFQPIWRILVNLDHFPK